MASIFDKMTIDEIEKTIEILIKNKELEIRDRFKKSDVLCNIEYARGELSAYNRALEYIQRRKN